VDELRGTPMSVGTLEEIIDDNHAIVSTSMGPEYYVGIMSFVNKDLLEPGCSVLLHNKVNHHRICYDFIVNCILHLDRLMQ
jgi:26S proteasome regulatory subunit T2